jgi:hypothetical protein
MDVGQSAFDLLKLLGHQKRQSQSTQIRIRVVRVRSSPAGFCRLSPVLQERGLCCAIACRARLCGRLNTGLEEGTMKATTLPEQPDAKSPAGADIRFIMDGETGNMT